MTCSGNPYYTISDTPAGEPPVTARLKIKRSVFTCRLSRARTIKAAKSFIAAVTKENKIATHNCWAYVVGETGQICHSSDAGEPSGTAGKPMLNVLSSHAMTQVAAVVTRQYGGVKLGIRGLIAAYSDAVEAALAAARIVRLIQADTIRVQVPYDLNDTLMNRVSTYSAGVVHTDYGERITHDILVERHRIDAFYTLLAGYKSRGVKVLPVSVDRS